MQVIGLCRFSYPAVGGFQREHDTLDARRAYLYADARLAHRFRLFQSLCLPSIALQSDTSDFTFLILTGDDLPAWAMAKLKDLTRPYPHIEIVIEAPKPHRDIASEVINEYRRWPRPHCAQFRLDDDDAVHLDYVAALKDTADRAVTFFDGAPKFAIDYSSGYAATLDHNGLAVYEVNEPLWTPALAAVFRKGSDRTIMNYAHHKIANRMPSIRLERPQMFIRSFHDDNDSGAVRANPAYPTRPLDTEMEEAFLSEFGLDNAMIKELWRDA